MLTLLRLSIGISLCFSAVVCVAAPKSELIEFWHESDDSNTATIDHTPWQEILDAYLDSDHESGISRFNYKGLMAQDEDKNKLRTYVLDLSKLDPREYSQREQKAYWINFYNALTVYVVLTEYPVKSIRDINSGILTSGPWEKEWIKVQDQGITLNDIEHGILRPIYEDPRIHYALCCASLGCPNLSAKAYSAENLDQLLDDGARAYINHPRGVEINNNKLRVSSIFAWYKEDFGRTNEGVIEHLKKYADEELAASLEEFSKFSNHYDWALNEP